MAGRVLEATASQGRDTDNLRRAAHRPECQIDRHSRRPWYKNSFTAPGTKHRHVYPPRRKSPRDCEGPWRQALSRTKPPNKRPLPCAERSSITDAPVSSSQRKRPSWVFSISLTIAKNLDWQQVDMFHLGGPPRFPTPLLFDDREGAAYRPLYERLRCFGQRPERNRRGNWDHHRFRIDRAFFRCPPGVRYSHFRPDCPATRAQHACNRSGLGATDMNSISYAAQRLRRGWEKRWRSGADAVPEETSRSEARLFLLNWLLGISDFYKRQTLG